MNRAVKIHTRVAHPPVSTAREVGGYVPAVQWPQIAGPVRPFEPRRLYLG